MSPGGGGERRVRLVGALVTFRRHEGLRAVLDGLAAQTRPLDHLVVVDNAPVAVTEAIVAEYAARGLSVDYLPSPTNLGSQGGMAAAMEHVLLDAGDEDWVLALDDDQPPDRPELVESVLRFALDCLTADDRTALVGAVGARFDRRTGRLTRLTDEELAGRVRVDYVGTGHLATYRVRALRDVGVLPAEFFFGFGELELGLRLADAGWHVYADGDMQASFRRRYGIWGTSVPQGVRSISGPPPWRQYYSLRNLIWILRRHGHGGAALRVTLVSGIAKPLANVPRHPVAAAGHLRLNARAVTDAWTGRLGRRLAPDLARYPS